MSRGPYNLRGVGSYSELPEHHKQMRREAAKRWRDNHPELKRDYQYKSFYGMELGTYARMLEDQKGACILCGKVPVAPDRLHVDHNHKTGKVRALICKKCNMAVGVVEGGIEHYLAYLEAHA